MQFFCHTIYHFDAADSSNLEKNEGHVQSVHEDIVSVFFYDLFTKKNSKVPHHFLYGSLNLLKQSWMLILNILV